MDHFVVFLLTSHFFVLASGLEKHDDRIIISGGTIQDFISYSIQKYVGALGISCLMQTEAVYCNSCTHNASLFENAP